MNNPKVFIGSSSEGIPQANHVKKKLESIGTVELWSNTFEPNVSAFDNLLNNADQYDFAIMILTADDMRLSRENIDIIGRDNVIFEFGLFLGRLERHRTYLLIENGIEPPSDWKGITLPPFDANEESPTASLLEVCDTLTQIIKERYRQSQFGFLPSTALALGYFENFLKPLVHHISSFLPHFKHGDSTYENVLIHIYIPDDLTERIEPFARQYKWCPTEIKRPGLSRDFPLHVVMNTTGPNDLILVDLPTTLNTAALVIDKYVNQRSLGPSERKTQLLQKEFKNFTATLTNLIEADAFTKNMVFITHSPELR
jgi:hypothetical protein